MFSLHPRILLIPTLVFGPAGVAHASPSEFGQPELVQIRSVNATYADPCSISSTAGSVATPGRAQIGRRAAIYLIQHVQRACQILAGIRDQGSPSQALAPMYDAIRQDLYAGILDPVYRAHPALRDAALPKALSLKQPHASARDVPRVTASRLVDALRDLQRRISKLAELTADQQADKQSAERALQPFLDAGIELFLAQGIAFDAYPDLREKNLAAMLPEVRTQESDERFRKRSPAPGSVRLSRSALALVRSFMQQVRRATSRSDQIAWIGWASEQRTRRPGEAGWISLGGGWVLGAYARGQLPPDVVDKVEGLEIVFSAEDQPSGLIGKTIDAAKGKLFIRD